MSRVVIDVARACGIPAIFIQEVHRPNLVYFGRDFDGDETIHCLENICVRYTFIGDHQGDYYCRVMEDCVAGSSTSAHKASLKAMEYLQTGARRSLDAVVASMLDAPAA